VAITLQILLKYFFYIFYATECPIVKLEEINSWSLDFDCRYKKANVIMLFCRGRLNKEKNSSAIGSKMVLYLFKGSTYNILFLSEICFKIETTF